MQTLIHPQLPKYLQVAERLRQEIETGVWKVGDRLPGYSESQSRYSTTKNTLEKAHQLLEREGLIRRVNGVGVFVAEPRKRSLTGLIGVVHVPTDPSSEFPGEGHTSYEMHLMQGIKSAAQEGGVEILLLNARPAAGWERVDGVLAHGNGAHYLQSLGLPIPTVTMMHRIPGTPGVLTEDRDGARQATEYLISLGHRRIGYLIDASQGNQLSIERLAGYKQALKAGHIRYSAQLIGELLNCGPMLMRGRESMKQWLQNGWRDLGCTALLVQNDRAAIGAMESLREAGIRVPHDVSVIGFDSTDECEIVSPRLTSLRVPLEEIGLRATQMLLRIINEDGLKPEPVILPVELQVRESTAPPAMQARS